MPRPLLFLDIDGTLIPFGAPAASGRPVAPTGNPLLARLDPDHGRRLRGLGVDLVWATSWMSDANDEVAPRLGLPALPVVDWPDTPDDGLHWKTRTLVAYGAGRAFAWVDDEVTDADVDWVVRHHPWPALVHRVDARAGLTDADFDILEAWLDRLATA